MMKNLIGIITIVLLVSLASESFSQRFGIKGGLNLANMLMEDEDDTYSDDFEMNPGFHVGPVVEFPLNEAFSIESGLLLTTKGFKMSDSWSFMDEPIDYEYKLNLLYLDVPVTLKAMADVGNMKLYGNIGPYVGMGLVGKYQFESSGSDESDNYEEDVEWGSDPEEDDFKRLDYGLTFGAGVQFNALQIGVSYGLGMANISAYTDDGDVVNNRVLGISLGILF